VLLLKGKGVENAAALLGGMAAWKAAGLPVEGRAAAPEGNKNK
jgi:3-mercaptopyruvate sulfurtransferase SseA